MTSLFEHPDSQDLLPEIVSALLAESDRGAVLVAGSFIDAQLRSLFESAAPAGLTPKELGAALEYPGPLASLAAKAQTAHLLGLLPRTTYDAINRLRRLRNELAHSKRHFRLKDHEQQVRAIYDIGEGIAPFVNRLACEALLKSFLDRVMDISHPLRDDGSKAFDSVDELLTYLSDRTDLLEPLEERRPRCELGFGTAMICASLIHHREQVKDRLAFGPLWSSKAASIPGPSDSAS